MSIFTIDRIWLGSLRNTYFQKLVANIRTYVDGVPTQNTHPYVNVTDATTYTVLAVDSGRTHIIPDLTATCTLTLPAVQDGLSFKFWGNLTVQDAQNWIINTTDGDFEGGVGFHDIDGDAHTAVFSDATDNTLTVVTPEAGCWVEVISNGTDWYLNGSIVSDTVPTLTTV